MRTVFFILIFSISIFSYGQYNLNANSSGYEEYKLVIGEEEYRIDSISFTKIKSEWINKIEILKSDEEKNIYGNKNGLVLIYLQKQYYSESENILNELELITQKERIVQEELNIIVDAIVQSRLKEVSVIQKETMPVSFLSNRNEKSKLPPPPIQDRIRYSKSLFESFIEVKTLSKSDCEQMISSISSNTTYIINSEKISKKVLSKSYLDSLFDVANDSAYNKIREEFGTSCFIRVSTPIFNETMDRVVLAIDYYCGYLYGEGLVFVLEKKKNKWCIIDERGRWVS